MDLSFSNIVVRLLVAVLVYFLFNEVISVFISDAQAARIFRIVLLIVCLAIVFVAGFIFR